MRIRGLDVWMALAVALFVGALPLHVCMPHSGEPASVQVAGCHGHDHEHGVPAPRPGGACCEDVPLDRATPAAAVVVPAAVPAGTAPGLPPAHGGTVADAAPVADASPPRDRGLIVLLR